MAGVKVRSSFFLAVAGVKVFKLLFLLLLGLPLVVNAQFTFLTQQRQPHHHRIHGLWWRCCYSGYTTTVWRSPTSGTNAFFSCTNITSLEIPGSISDIAYKAFTQCTGLKTVIIGEGTLSIEDYAFFDCTALTNVVIPASVTNIGSGAFRYCFALSTITLEPTNSSYCIDG